MNAIKAMIAKKAIYGISSLLYDLFRYIFTGFGENRNPDNKKNNGMWKQ